MKTFKLISLDIVEEKNEDITQRRIKLQDGLIINREDDHGRWVIEAYMDSSYRSFFEDMYRNGDEIIIQAKITKQTNRPATFMVKPIDFNEIGGSMNVIFMGTMMDRQQEQVEKVLKQLLDEGYQGDDLLEQFKQKGSESKA
ncbi:YwpF-like family protein [Halobacillus kuroshimensis]|uniref:YwpF-like family protein n=1 Tax=Halobacillus kuroshimensis TaxID=302481 RepID=A0ABS3DS82_9BACI|nr:MULTISPECIES: YwpF-like family protein [Halobacillus]MBN8234210.1 YwpF-like family protein [Halobacillus kuroshimensis]